MERVWLRLDLVGIVLLTADDLVSGTYMVFWCEPLLRGIYWAMVGPAAPPPSLSSREPASHQGLTEVFTPRRSYPWGP